MPVRPRGALSGPDSTRPGLHGFVLGDRFVLLEPLGEGGHAVVWRARDRMMRTLVAVKILRPGIERAFYRDIDAFYFAANMVELLSPTVRRQQDLDKLQQELFLRNNKFDMKLRECQLSIKKQMNIRDEFNNFCQK